MTVEQGEDEREVIPRWRPFESSIRTGELDALSPAPLEAIEPELGKLRDEYEKTRNPFIAGDLLSALVASKAKQSEIDQLAEAILLSGDAEDSLQRFATRLLNPDETPDEQGDRLRPTSIDASRAVVRRMRRLLRHDPRNAVRRVDLALAQLTLGNRDAARRQIRAALSLAPSNRFVLRSTVRFLISENAPDEAVFVLRHSEQREQDPWILAATLSAAQLADMPVAHARQAREMLSSQDFAPRDLSELASELATLEIHAGRMKRARLLFQQALIDPNENSVAQADWASSVSGLTLPQELLQIARGYEARSRAFAREGNWNAATSEGIAWQRDEPFALEPALNTSYAAALGLEDFDTALEVARIGLRSNPEDALLRNNAAYAAASLGRVNEAREFMDGIQGFDDESGFNTFQATHGLVLFREGNFPAGRLKYQEALDGFARSARRDLIPMATILWALEEIRIGSSLSTNLVKHARRYAKESDHPDTPLLLERLNRRVAQSPLSEEQFQ